MTRSDRARRSGKSSGRTSAKTFRNGRAVWLVGAALSVLAGTTAAQAQTTEWIGTSPDWFNGANWSAGTPAGGIDARISTTAPNPTVINIPGAVARHVILGFGAATTGQLTVTGPGTTLAASGDVVVGLNGGGTLRVENDADVTANQTIVSDNNAGLTGILTVSGTGSTFTNATGTYIGQGISGSVIVENEGAFQTDFSRIGNQTNGSVTVTGAGSTYTSTTFANIGDVGTSIGVVTVQNGGTFSAASITIAAGAATTGWLNIGAASGAPAQAPGTVTGPITFGPGNALLVFNHTSAGYAFAPVLSGTGTVVVENGTTAFTATNTYTGPTIVIGGTFRISNTGSITSDVTTGAGGTVTNAGNITGALAANAGTTTNLVLGVWDGDVTSNTGIVNNNIAGAWTGNVIANAGTITNAGQWSGDLNNTAGSVTNAGVWTGNLANAGTFTQASTGNTTGSLTNTGTVDAQGGGFTGGVANTGAGIFNVTGAAVNGGVVTNGSAARINVGVGAGLNAVSITNSGNAAIVNNGTITSALTVNGGTVGGSGIFAGNAIFNGGTLSPGNSIGTINFSGSLVLNAATTYLVEVDPNASDRTNVSGAATLGGATVSAQFAPGSYVNRRYTILNATGGVSGTFNSLVNTNLPANFTSSLSYDATNAYLDLTLNVVPPPGAPNFNGGLNGNQTNVAQALVNSFNTAGGIPLVFAALTPQGLTQVSGEAATGTQQTTFSAMDQFLNVMTDPFLGTRSGGAPQTGVAGYADDNEALAYAAKRKGRNPAEQDAYAAVVRKAQPRMAFERRWSVWGAGYGGTQSTDSNAAVGSNDVTSRVYGGAAGFDYRLTPETALGFSLGGAGTKYNLANGLGGGSSEMFQAGIYGRHHFGPGYIAGALAYAWQDVTTDRVALLNSYRANFDANALSGRLEAGWRYAFGTSGLTPYAAGQFTTFFLPDYAEQVVAGTNLFALSYAEKDVTASRSELGLRADTSFAAQDAVVTLRGRAAWAHNFNTDRSVSAIFQTLPAAGFVMNGAAQARDAALVSAGAEARWLNGFSVAATFEGEFSSVTESYAGKGVLRYQW